MLISNIKKLIKTYFPNDVNNFLKKIRDRFFAPRIPGYKVFIDFLKGRSGIEIGGPSAMFRSSLPVYLFINSLDGVNFSDSTVWEGRLTSGKNYKFFGTKKGFQFISDGTNLPEIPANSYDFVLSSNCLEHIANPLKALSEWKRILRSQGVMILVLPNKHSNFDHKRPVTSFEHLLEDYKNNMSEHDLTHLDEILSLHDLSLDPSAGDFENFRARSLKNFENRCLHHHIFDICIMREMFDFLKMSVIKEIETKDDFIMLALKTH